MKLSIRLALVAGILASTLSATDPRASFAH